MGFGFNLVTTVDSIDEKEDHYIVDVALAQGAMVNRQVMLVRARARAMIATGVVENVGNQSRDIAEAIENLELGKIKRSTEVVNDQGRIVTIKVNK